MNNLNEIFFAPAANQELTYDQVLEDVQRYFAENHASTIAEAGEANAERATSLLKELMVQYIVMDGSGGTIIIHADLIQHSGICAACAHSAQFAAQMFDRALHLVFVNLGVAAHCGSLLFLFILGLRCNASAL